MVGLTIIQTNRDEMSQQVEEVDVTASVEALWKLQTLPVDVCVTPLRDGPHYSGIFAEKGQHLGQITGVREYDLKIDI